MCQADLCGFSALDCCLCSLCEEQRRMERIAPGSKGFPRIIEALIGVGKQSITGLPFLNRHPIQHGIRVFSVLKKLLDRLHPFGDINLLRAFG